jgi:hypothetical protein
MRQRFSFWAALLILLAASPYTAPFRICGDTLVPDSTRPTANDADTSSQIGSPVERIVRRVTPLAPLLAFDVALPARSTAVDMHSVAEADPFNASPQSTVLRI